MSNRKSDGASPPTAPKPKKGSLLHILVKDKIETHKSQLKRSLMEAEEAEEELKYVLLKCKHVSDFNFIFNGGKSVQMQIQIFIAV